MRPPPQAGEVQCTFLFRSHHPQKQYATPSRIGQRALPGALGFSIGTMPLPDPDPGEHAWADDDGQFVADDHAGMRRSQPRFRTVGPDDGVARKNTSPAVVAGDVVRPCLVQACAIAGPAAPPANANSRMARQKRRCDRSCRPPPVTRAGRCSGRPWLAREPWCRRARIPVQGTSRRCRHDGGGAGFPNKFNELGKFQRDRARASLAKSFLPLQERASGEMAEWLKAHAWKACVRETVPWVRIPLSPPERTPVRPEDIGNRSYLRDG